MSRIIAVCNQKGGVGKTTTSVNLGAYLARAGKRVLIIDADPQGNATSGLGVDKRSVERSVYHVLMQDLSLQECTVPTATSGLSLAPAHIDMTGIELELSTQEAREYRLRRKVWEERSLYDFVIIDSPPSLGLLTINALVAADRVLIPVQCEFYALEGLSQLLQTINMVRASLNPDLGIEGVLLTMADYRTKLTQEVIQETRGHFQHRVFSVVIPRNVRLSEAPGHGQPIADYDATSIGAKSYEVLTAEILQDKLNI